MLAVLTTHPIQYQVPLWKMLAARKRVPFKVFYMSDQGLKSRFDPGFNRSVSWDIDLLDGYDYEFLDTHKGRQWESFWGLRLKPEFRDTLAKMHAKVLWIQGWQVAAYWQAAFEARKLGLEVWLRGETNARSNAGGIGKQLKRQVLRQLLSRADRLLYIGQANRQFYLEQGISPERLTPAPYCVDNERFAVTAEAIRHSRDQLRNGWGIRPDAFCFVFVGKFIEKKRPTDLVDAARRLQSDFSGKRIHVLWVGTGELYREFSQGCNVCFDQHPDARNARQSAPHDGLNVSFAGFLNQSEVTRAYVAADCLVLPSNAKETWGLVVNEAMATGLPCIVSSACGCSEDLVEPVRPDLCYPVGDVAALEAAMKAVMSHPPSPKLLTAHVAKYRAEKTIDAVESLYFQVGNVVD